MSALFFQFMILHNNEMIYIVFFIYIIRVISKKLNIFKYILYNNNKKFIKLIKFAILNYIYYSSLNYYLLIFPFLLNMFSTFFFYLYKLIYIKRIIYFFINFNKIFLLI